MLYSEESEWWIPESNEFCLICLRVGGGDLSSMSMMRHEQGKDSGPLAKPWLAWLEWLALVLFPPTKTRCHKLLLDVWGKWNPRVRVADDPEEAVNHDDSLDNVFFFCCCRSADCDLSSWPAAPFPGADDALRLTKSSATRFSWIRSKVLKRKEKESRITSRLSPAAAAWEIFRTGAQCWRWWWFKMFTPLQAKLGSDLLVRSQQQQNPKDLMCENVLISQFAIIAS